MCLNCISKDCALCYEHDKFTRIKEKKLYAVYILECNDGSYYTGITTDLIRRIIEHNSGKGAKYTKTRRPVKYLETTDYIFNRSEASYLEHRIKQHPKMYKVLFLTAYVTGWKDILGKRIQK